MAPKVVLVVFLLAPISIALGREQLGVGVGVTGSFKITTMWLCECLCWKPRAAESLWWSFMILSLTMSGEVLFDGFERKNSDETHPCFESDFRTWCNGPHKQSDDGSFLSFKPLKVIEQLQLLSSKSYSALLTHLCSKHVLECIPWTNHRCSWIPQSGLGF